MEKKESIFISSDMEGVSGVCSWDEVTKGKSEYEQFQKYMTDELFSICSAITETSQIVIHDSHWTGRNIIHARLPESVEMIRNFNGHIDGMMYGINSNFSATILHGYHSAGGNNGNPLSHTIHSGRIDYIKLNGEVIGETTISILTSSLYNVPVCHVTGDEGAIIEAQSLNKNIVGTVTKIGTGDSVINKHPNVVNREIHDNTSKAIEMLEENKDLFKVEIPNKLEFEIFYKKHQHAYRNSFFPNTILNGNKSILIKTNDFNDILKVIHFCITEW